MPTFSYSARPATGGEMQTGELDLPTKDEVLAHLHRQKLIPVSVREKPKELTISFGTGITMRDIVIFTRQFATMINSGLPLVQSLDILAEQTENQALRKTISEVLYDVESGHTLADAMGKHPKVFTDLYVNMVAAGEAGGILDTILLRLATFLEKNDALIRKIKGAMIYPGVILSVAAAAIVILLIFVIPTFQSMFESAGIPLPLPTQIVIGMSAFLQAWWWACGVGLIAAVVGIRQFYQTDNGELLIDRILLAMPILGDLQRKAAVARFTRTLGTLVSSGVSILEGLEITARTSGNAIVEDAIMATRRSVEEGKTIAEPLKGTDVFPDMVVQMVAVGEQTGALETMLTKIADFYEDEVDEATANLLALLEPIMIFFLGVVIGGIVISMYLPMFDLITKIG